MRCLLTTAAAAILSLAPAAIWALPDAKAAEQLGDELSSTFHHDAAVPVLSEATNREDPTEIQDPENAGHSGASGEDPIAQWLSSLPSAGMPDGSMFTSSLFNTLTVSSDFASVTPLAEPHFLSSPPNLITSTATDNDDSTGPRPTPRVDANILFHSNSQKPLGPLSQAWKSTKAKLRCISSFLCPEHRGDKSLSDDRSQVVFDTGIYHNEAQIKEILDSSSSPPPSYGTPSVVLSQPTPGHVVPSRAAIPTATLAATGVTRILVTHLAEPTGASNGHASSSVDHTTTTVIAAVLSVIGTVLVTWLIFSVLVWRNPRRRAERLARWEECRKLREYRQAANRHRLRRWGQATFGRLWLFIGVGLTTTQIVGSDVEKDVAVEDLLHADMHTGLRVAGGRLSEEIHNFRNAHSQVAALLRAEEGRSSRFKQHPADRNRRRTYMWLFGGRRNRPRSNSDSDSDSGSIHSDSEKSILTGVTPPPPYEEREKFAQVDDRFLIRVVTGARDSSDRSSVSSLVPTSPKEGSMTLGSHISSSEKGDL